MGIGQSSAGLKGAPSFLKKKEIRDFANSTHFSPDEISALWTHFQHLVPYTKTPGVIEPDEFREALGIKDTHFLDRMFHLFDTDQDGRISFPEFIVGLSVLSSRGSLAEKTLFSFKIFDFDNDEKISRGELREMVCASLTENDVYLTDSHIDDVVNSTFDTADTNKNGFIDWEEYRNIVQERPSMLNNMTVDLRKLLEPGFDAEATANTMMDIE